MTPLAKEGITIECRGCGHPVAKRLTKFSHKCPSCLTFAPANTSDDDKLLHQQVKEYDRKMHIGCACTVVAFLTLLMTLHRLFW